MRWAGVAWPCLAILRAGRGMEIGWISPGLAVGWASPKVDTGWAGAGLSWVFLGKDGLA
jgi:hypothetical protein